MLEFAESLPQLRGRSAVIRRAARVADCGSSLVCALAIALLVVLLAGTVSGYSPLIDHSDSMRPALRAGDLILTHAEAATSVRTGNIVTFVDLALGSKLVTHRVLAYRAAGTRIDFTTRGDANSASETWSVDRRASVAKMVFRVPAIGRSMAWMAAPWPRSILLGLAALVLSTALLRRIWRA